MTCGLQMNSLFNSEVVLCPQSYHLHMLTWYANHLLNQMWFMPPKLNAPHCLTRDTRTGFLH